jgi:hypothetical protein
VFTFITKWLCGAGYHNGPKVGEGKILLDDKRNKERRQLQGRYNIRRCRRSFCRRYFSNPEDLIQRAA